MYRLILTNGKRKGRRLRIDGKKATIGSGDKCTVSIPDASLAAEQAELHQSETGVYLKKLDGSVAINGEEIEQALLHDGDVFSVGALSFRFRASKSSQLYRRRRGDAIQFLTLAAVLAILLIEVLLLFGWTIYLNIEPSDTAQSTPSSAGEALESRHEGPRGEIANPDQDSSKD